MRRAPQTRARNMRDEAPLPAPGVPWERLRTKVGRHDSERGAQHRLSKLAVGYGGGGDEGRGWTVPRARFPRDRSLPRESDGGYFVYGIGAERERVAEFFMSAFVERRACSSALAGGTAGPAPPGQQ